MKKNIYNYSKKALENYFVEKGMEKFRATQIIEGIYRQGAKSFFDIKGLKKTVMELLDEEFVFSELEIVEKNISDDGTIKYLYRLHDGQLIETVLMSHNYGYSVCVSTQVGCNMGCAFCASGLVKRVRNLEIGEMINQVLTIDLDLRKEQKRVSHVVIMGIGEPFDNYDNVTEFMSIINEVKGLEIGARHITVSTCGIVPKIREFASFPLQVNLAISLHFPTDDARSQYMKINKKYNLDELIEALDYYYEKTNRRITFEYILLKDINDRLEDAMNLVRLVRNMNCYINLIPYNETGSIFRRSPSERVHEFYDFLKKNKMNVTLRREQGHDILAACGQLRVSKMEK